MQQVFTEAQCQELLRVRFYCTYLTANNSACHSFIDAGRRHKTSELGTKEVITHGIAGSISVTFAWVHPCPQISWETNLPPMPEYDIISVFQGYLLFKHPGEDVQARLGETQDNHGEFVQTDERRGEMQEPYCVSGWEAVLL